MNPFAELPAWLGVVVALLAAVVLVALNLGWLLAAKSMLDGQRQKHARARADARGTTDKAVDEGGPTDRTPIN